MIKIKNLIGLPSLQYHVDNNLSLYENVYRYSSKSFIQLFTEARDAWRDGLIELNEEDIQLLESTDIGEYGIFEGQKVPLDLPMVYEEEYYVTVNRGPKLGKSLVRSAESDYEEPRIFSKEEAEEYIKRVKSSGATPGQIASYWVSDRDMNRIDEDDIDEAEYKGKDVALNKPKRGGPKKFYVYVKNPKTGNVKKVNFGDSGNLSVKIKEPGARASFAARHKCSTKKDKTKPGYWSCNIGRYWKSLGGSRNFSGYW